MRNKANRPTLDTVFVFGAGASYDASLTRNPKATRVSPLDKDFCNRITTYSASRTCPTWFKDSASLILSSWRDDKQFEECGLEEAVLLQSAHLNFLSAIEPRRLPKTHHGRGYALTNEWDFVYHIAHMVSHVLRKSVEKSSQPYCKIVQKYFDSDSCDHTNRAITFNYDTLFDQHLLRRFDAGKIYFPEIGYGSGLGASNPLLLKLHGSANWYIPADEFHTAFGSQHPSDKPYNIEMAGLIKGISPATDHDRCPLIIPPVPNKPITEISLFRSLWTRAAEYLAEARNIVICGYSLPETDIIAKSLFKNVRNMKVTDISIVDPDGATVVKWKNLLNKKVNTQLRWHYFSSLSEFVRQECS